MATKGRKKCEELSKEREHGRQLVEKATAGDQAGVLKLLEAGVSVNAEEYNRYLFYRSENYMSPLQCAAKYGHEEVTKLLIEAGADVDAGDRFDVTATHLAAEKGKVACLRLLLDAGAECNIPTKFSKYGCYTAVPHVGGTTPLHLATKENQIACLRELILNGADYNSVDELGRTSLYLAAELGYEEAVLIHLHNAIGRDILSLPVNTTSDTPLHEAVRHGLTACISELLRHGSDVNHRNTMGYSPLHLAVHNTDSFNLTIVKELVKNGYEADVNQPDGNGTTPLQYACFNDNSKQGRRPQLAAFLIAYGAMFMWIKDRHGHTVLQHELMSVSPDKTILQAIVKTLNKPPVISDIGIPPARNGTHDQSINAKCCWYTYFCNAVRSLQHYCRVTVRNALGVKRLRNVHTLPLPSTLQDYVLLEYSEYR